MSGIVFVSIVGYKTSFSFDALRSLLPVQWLLWDGLEWISARISLSLLCMCFTRSPADVHVFVLMDILSGEYLVHHVGKYNYMNSTIIWVEV
jgi:hypothetical protein